MKLFYDGQCGLCIDSANLIRSIDFLKRVKLVDFSCLKPDEFPKGLSYEDCKVEMKVVTDCGAIHGGFYAFRALAWKLPIFWFLIPFLYLPGAAKAGLAVYRWVALNRNRFGR